MAWTYTFLSGIIVTGWNWAVIQAQPVAERWAAWTARWDGQIQGTMPLPTDPDPEERLRADMFLKKSDGTQRLGTTKCHSCRTSKARCQVPTRATFFDTLYCGCQYDEALLEAYLVRRGFLGQGKGKGVPQTLGSDHRRLILLLLEDQFGEDFTVDMLLSSQKRVAVLHSAMTNGTMVDLPV